MIRRILSYAINKLFLIIPVYLFYNLIYVKSGLYLKYMCQDSGGLSGLFIIGAILGILCLPYAGLVSSGIIDNGIYISFSNLIEPLIIVSGFIVVDTIICVLLNEDIGKNLVGLKIYTNIGQQVKWQQYLGRNIIKYLSIMFFPVVAIYPLLNESHCTLHDQICKTQVNKRRDTHIE